MSNDPELDPATIASYFVDDFTEILRDLVRAIAASGSSGALASASSGMRRFEESLNDPRTPSELNWYKIFDGAITKLKSPSPPDSFYHEFLPLGLASMRYVAELSASDNFSAARISQARNAVEKEIERVGERRAEKRRKLD